MGASFSGNIFGVSKDRSESSMVTKQATNINQTCVGQAQAANYVKDVSITIEGVKCTEIGVIVNTVNFNTACATQASMNTVVTNMADQVAGLINQGGVSAGLNIFGATIDTNSTNIQTQITDNLNDLCGSDDKAVNYVDGATIKVENVSCEDMNIMQNNSSIQAQCHMLATQNTYANNTALQKAGGQTTGIFNKLFTTIPGLLITLAIIGAIAAVVMYLLHSNAMSNRASNAAHYIQYRNIPAGANPALTKLDAQHAMYAAGMPGAGAMGRVLPQQVSMAQMPAQMPMAQMPVMPRAVAAV